VSRVGSQCRGYRQHPAPPPPAGEWGPAAAAAVEVDLGALSHPGKLRPNNEDHFLAVRLQRTMRALLTNLPDGAVPPRHADTAYGLVVADGVGGGPGGEVASRTAIGVLADLVLATPDWIMRLDDQLAEEVMRRLGERFGTVREALRRRARADPALAGMATTMTLASSLGADLVVAHVGDSRAYLFRGGTLHRLTRDHTLAQELADRGGGLPPASVLRRLRRVLTNALSAGAADVRTEVHRLRLLDGDALLLCTDGLTDMVPEEAIADALGRPETAADTCRVLADRALEAGGRDNVTVVLARYRIPGA
jgi:PPM family protein phosphatase